MSEKLQIASSCVICGAPIYAEESTGNTSKESSAPKIMYTCECRNATKKQTNQDGGLRKYGALVS